MKKDEVKNTQYRALMKIAPKLIDAHPSSIKKWLDVLVKLLEK